MAAGGAAEVSDATALRNDAAATMATGEAAPRRPGPEATDPFRGSGASDTAGALAGPAVHTAGKSGEPEEPREPGESREPGRSREPGEPGESRDSREPEHPGSKGAPSSIVIPRHPRESGEQAGIRIQGEREKAEGDSQARELVAAWEQEGRIDLGEAARRLEAALHDIDRAGVRTIHGFCQRALADLAFESGFPFGFEVSGSDAGMVAAAVRDFWRRRLYPASTLLVRHAVESGFLPSGLTEWTSRRRAGNAEVRGGEPLSEPIEALEAVWRREFEAVRFEWTQHRETFRGEILDGDWLNRRSYGRKKVERDLDGLEALFAAAEPRLPPPDLAARYGRERLSQPRSVKKGFAPPEHLHPLFDAFDRLEEASDGLRSACDQWLRWAHRDMLDEVRASVRRRVREDRRLGYDDLLSELGDALAGPHGERLAARIRHEYPCALIDEFQDTDPVQAAIFTRVYGEGRRGAGQDAADPTVARGERSGDGRRGTEQDTVDPAVVRERSGEGHRGAETGRCRSGGHARRALRRRPPRYGTGHGRSGSRARRALRRRPSRRGAGCGRRGPPLRRRRSEAVHLPFSGGGRLCLPRGPAPRPRASCARAELALGACPRRSGERGVRRTRCVRDPRDPVPPGGRGPARRQSATDRFPRGRRPRPVRAPPWERGRPARRGDRRVDPARLLLRSWGGRRPARNRRRQRRRTLRIPLRERGRPACLGRSRANHFGFRAVIPCHSCEIGNPGVRGTARPGRRGCPARDRRTRRRRILRIPAPAGSGGSRKASHEGEREPDRHGIGRARDRASAGSGQARRGRDRRRTAHRRGCRGAGPHPGPGPADRGGVARAGGAQRRDRRPQRVRDG